MEGIELCVVCGSFTDPHHVVAVRDLALGVANRCAGCKVLEVALGLFPQYAQQTSQLFWSVDRSIFVRLLDQSKNLIAVLELFTDPGKPCLVRLVGPARTVSPEPWNKSLVELAKAWLQNCTDYHTICRRSSPTILPTRVIDVGKNDRAIRLHITRSEVARYVALSHCWGSSKPIETRTSNLQQHMKRIKLDANSKTFADAIRVTRDLGFQYLWIDSLCIIQDDKEDWASEASRMSQVYRNAAFTISAEAAASACDGLFTHTARRAELQVQHTFKFPGLTDRKVSVNVRLRDASCLNSVMPPHASRPTPSAELSKRAWVVQERLLSPRMLHFYEHELAWSCCSISACECRCDAGIAENSVFKNLGNDATTKSRMEYEMQRQWPGLVTNFSTKKLTYATDRLPALSGLAGLVKEVTNFEYYAGLWQFDVPYGLLWFSDHQKANQHPITRFKSSARVPSWTWASVVGPVTYLERHRTQFEHRTRTAEVKPLLQFIRAETTAAGLNKFGDVTSGSVTVRGQLLRVKYIVPRQVWRPFNPTYTPTEALSNEESDPADEIARRLHNLSIAYYPEPTYEPKITYDVLDEDPTKGLKIEDHWNPEQYQYFFLRAGIHITGGLFSSHSQESLCLLLRGYKLQGKTDARMYYERIGILVRGFHSYDVWQHQPCAEVTLV